MTYRNYDNDHNEQHSFDYRNKIPPQRDWHKQPVISGSEKPQKRPSKHHSESYQPSLFEWVEEESTKEQLRNGALDKAAKWDALIAAWERWNAAGWDMDEIGEALYDTLNEIIHPDESTEG